MNIDDLKWLLQDKRVEEAINKHLWIESQKAGYSIGIERATEEWLRLYALGWMKYNMPDEYEKMTQKKDRRRAKKKTIKKTARKTATKTKK